ncbi:MAG: hypothetical protein HKN09_11350 [Saprospiraceae bacterium]|nr:hypothetical protein [Saprospiraceae bacterium]
MFLSSAMNGQSLKAFLKAGEEAMLGGDYYNAMYYYTTALEFDTTRLDIHYNLGEASRYFNAYVPASKAYQYVLDNDSENAYPDASYNLALTLQNLGQYDEATTYFNLYLSEYGDLDERVSLKAENAITSIEWAKDQLDNPMPGVTVSTIEDGINTPYSEFGALDKSDAFYFTSMRFEKEKKGDRINKLYSQILVKDSSGIASPVESGINDYPQHIAHTAYNYDGSRVYFTLCDYEENLEINCDLYYMDLGPEGENNGVAKLPNHINIDSVTNTQPSIGYNPSTKEEYLYFASDREGGKGGLDIWYAKIESDSILEPVNIAAINSSEDDIAPFFHSPSGTLYFSTMAYMGMGGFDVFQSFKTGDDFSKPENLGVPVNTSFNDIYYTLNEDGDQAHYSSNKIGSLYLEDSYEACCYDIYKVDIEEIFLDLNALTYNGETLDSLTGVTVKIIDAITGELIEENLNEYGHEHEFEIKQGREYLIVSEREGFKSDTTNLSTRQITTSEEIIKKIYLTPIQVGLEVFTFSQRTKEDLTGVTVMLTEEGAEDNPMIITQDQTNLFQFEIIAGRTYTIIATKPGYSKEIITFEALDIKDGIITKFVYLLDGGGVLNEYLPMSVYFDNDRPDPRSVRMFSTKSYSDIYQAYMDQQDDYIENFTSGLGEEEATNAADAIKEFFVKEVKGGYDTLQLFLNDLEARLDAGDVVELTLRGLASPKAASRYNLALGQRRIWTLKNELINYNEGALIPYIEAGQLVLTEISLGEEIAPSSVSDSSRDRRRSVYSIEASRERKAQIVKARIINN